MSNTVKVTRDHITLLGAMAWGNEQGYPAVDEKRPFGFSYGYEAGACEAMGWAREGEDDGEPTYSEEQQQRAREIIGECLDVLLAIIDTARPGEYARDGAGNWHKLSSGEEPTTT